MRGTILTALVVAGILSGGGLSHRAEAMALAAHSPPGAAAAQPAVQQVANVCGSNGCVRVQTQKVKHQKPGNLGGHHI
jgi:hypothetical protein